MAMCPSEQDNQVTPYLLCNKLEFSRWKPTTAFTNDDVPHIERDIPIMNKYFCCIPQSADFVAVAPNYGLFTKYENLKQLNRAGGVDPYP